MGVIDIAERDYVLSRQDAELPEEFGFNYPHNIRDTFNMVAVLELFHMWPEQGGYLDQDALLIDDILMLKRIKNWVNDKNKPKGDDDDGSE